MSCQSFFLDRYNGLYPLRSRPYFISFFFDKLRIFGVLSFGNVCGLASFGISSGSLVQLWPSQWVEYKNLKSSFCVSKKSLIHIIYIIYIDKCTTNVYLWQMPTIQFPSFLQCSITVQDQSLNVSYSPGTTHQIKLTQIIIYGKW